MSALLYTSVTTSGYLSYYCLLWAWISLTSLFWPGINNAVSPTEMPLAGYFLFFGPFSVNPRDGYVWKSQQISSFWNTQTSPSGTSNHVQSNLSDLSSRFWVPLQLCCLNFCGNCDAFPPPPPPPGLFDEWKKVKQIIIYKMLVCECDPLCENTAKVIFWKM